MTALTALLMADRGELDFDAPVAKYWPEFAANGKAEVKVSHLMSPLRRPVRLEGEDHHARPLRLGKVTGLLAAQAPALGAGNRSGYHAITQGYLVGEVVRRITGKSLGTVFREEIAEPLGADFWIGLPASEDAPRRRTDPPPPGGAIGDMEQDEIRDHLQQSGHRRLGDPHPGLARRGDPGRRRHGQRPLDRRDPRHPRQRRRRQGQAFMSEAGCRKALEVQVSGRDLILGFPIRFGLGFAAQRRVRCRTPTQSTGAATADRLAVIDMDARTSFGYAMNKMLQTSADMRGLGLAMEFWKAQGLT